MNEAPAVLLTGGTAQVGLHILGDLLKAGINVASLSRKVAASEKIVHSDGARLMWYHPDQFSQLINVKLQSTADSWQPDCLISAGPINLAEVWLDRCESLRQIVCLSTSSVFSKAESANPAERAQIEKIQSSEKRLELVCKSRGLGLVILRPTLIYGCGMDENISLIAQFINRFGFVPLAGRAEGLRQPIHVADLAQLMVTIAQTKMSGQTSFEVTGGDTLTYRDMVARVFSALGKPERLFSFPQALLAKGVVLASKLPGMRGLNPQMVMRQNEDLVFSNLAVQQRYDFQPRGFRPGSEDFQLPDDLQRLLPALLRDP